MVTIVDVRTYLLDHQLDTAFESASMSFDRRQHLLVEVICSDGTVGWGECLGPALLNEPICRIMGKHLIGRNPLETEIIWNDLYHTFRDQGQRGLTVTALSGLDICLWDIKGKLLQQPISVLLGGRFRSVVKAYATGAFRRKGVDRIDDVLKEVTEYKAQGFHAMKLKIGFNVREDIELVRLVRETVGSDINLMIDANHGYDTREAIEVGRALAEFRVDWFEEPVLPELPRSYKEVRDKQPIAVAAGETWHSRWGMRRPIEERLIDIVQPDVCGVGGFTEFRKVVDLAQIHGVRVIPHVWGTGVQLAASLQAIAAIPHGTPRNEPLEPIFEFDRTINPYRQSVLLEPLEHHGGVMQIPDQAGLGIEVNRQALKQYALN